MAAHPTRIPEPPVSVFVAARHQAIRAALWSLFQTETDVEPLAATANAEELARLLATVTPAVVVVDESVLGSDGIAGLPAIVAAAPQSAFIVVGMHDHPAYVSRAREAGAADYVNLDDADRLGRAVVEAQRPVGAIRGRAGAPRQSCHDRGARSRRRVDGQPSAEHVVADTQVDATVRLRDLDAH